MDNASPLTVGDELPGYLKDKTPQAVLDLTMEEAYGISQESDPWPDGFTQADADALDNLYSSYISVHPTVPENTPFWNKTPADNQAFWSKRGSSDSM